MTANSETTAHQDLRTPIQFLKGVGQSRAEILARMGLRTVTDLLFCFPRSYEDMTELRGVEQLVEGEACSITGTVEEIEFRAFPSGKSVLGILIRLSDGFVRATWFNQQYMRDKFAEGMRLALSGKPRMKGLAWELAHPRVEFLGADEDFRQGRLLPVYPLTQGISQPQMRRLVHQAVDRFADLVREVFPEDFLTRQELVSIGRAIHDVHQPADRESLNRARHRLVYQELLVLQLALAMQRAQHRRRRDAPLIEVDARLHARIVRRFPFDLTAAQRQAVEAICADIGHPYPMNRLLQGDVGSGKTIVAVYAMLAAVAHRQQSAIMAPTEVLARQHHRSLSRLLEGSDVEIALLAGSQPAAQRRELLEAIESGDVDIVVGTQAVIQESVKFRQLGLVIVDEQHKFGVRQRALLRESGRAPHYLVMTATPIPRTIAMTLFGDLDVSTLRESPPGRRAVHTYLGLPGQRDEWWKFFRNKLHEGRQGYVIAPLVDDTEGSLASVQSMFEELSNDQLEGFRIDLLHGRMSTEEKERAMYGFATGETQVLVSTSVVEVGIDVANATLMTIESADRFGLAQLHQLRGRVSRGQFDGFVCAFVDTENESAQERLQAFASSTDGFELAEMDFRMRGPGNLLGERQHGMPPLRIADLHRDTAELEQARDDAGELIAEDESLSQPGWERLRKMVLNRYGEVLELGDVG